MNNSGLISLCVSFTVVAVLWMCVIEAVKRFIRSEIAKSRNNVI